MSPQCQAIYILAFAASIGSISRSIYAGDLEDDHGLIPNIAYVASEATNNTKKLIAAIELGEPLTSDSGGEFWFDGPLPLPAANRVKNTAYVAGDRVLADGNRIYVCISPGTSADSYAAPIGITDNQADGLNLRWDYVEEASTWDRNGLNIRGPTSQHAPQAIEEFGYLQGPNLRFNVRLPLNSDT
ncbi:MAG: hypothetical protein H0T51_05005 [Pirellulales bacterium]|nr:hypothetical protein [Pirellulales bacterium]